MITDIDDGRRFATSRIEYGRLILDVEIEWSIYGNDTSIWEVRDAETDVVYHHISPRHAGEIEELAVDKWCSRIY